MRIVVSTLLDATPEQVWADISNLASHVEWMHDATEIRFTSAVHTGLGTTFECDTKVGPLSTTDEMTITSWEPGRSLGVRHSGVVTGVGEFTLEAEGLGTRFTWDEELTFPLWLGGGFAAAASKPVLKAIWTRNLAGLRRRFLT
ncbi:MAG: SRPBCC family protein [Acidimicrobiales bacterium]